MQCSQNATFFGSEPESVGERIRGESIANRLSSHFAQQGWAVDTTDVWRDAGFYFSMTRSRESVQLIVAPYHGAPDRWILQIAPLHPRMIARWFGFKVSATPVCIFNAAIETQRILSDNGFTNFQWCWDEFAEGGHCHAQPPPPVDLNVPSPR